MYRNWICVAVLAASMTTSLSAQVRAFGVGCESHLTGLPQISTDAPPVVGSIFNLKMDTVDPSATFLLVFGISNTTWSGQSLPFDVSALGFPGCSLNVSYDKVFPLQSDSNGEMVIPVNTVALPAGARLYSQLIVPEPAGSRIAVSKGYELTLSGSVPDFTVMGIPDTQSYVIFASWAAIFESMAQWIVTNVTTENIAFVSHVGDIVANGAIGTNNNQAEWDNATTAIDHLDGDLVTKPDGVVPYSMGVGNRDYDIIHAKTAWTQYTTHFGASRFAGRSWFGGSGPDELSHYQVFKANGIDYLHLSLEWRPRDVAIEWARGVLEAHPELPTILTTHQYLNYTGNQYDDNGSTPNSGGDNGALGVRHKLVELYPQVFLVLCGHNPAGTFKTDSTALGGTVHAILMDYSFDPNGGNGWMNRIICSPDKGEIESDCFSNFYVPGTTGGIDRNTLATCNTTFTFDFNAHRRRLEANEVIHFVGGEDHGHGVYAGALDTFVSESQPATAFGSVGDVNSELTTPSSAQQGLIKFGALFGTAAGQIPATKPILRAVLTLTTEGIGAVSATSSDLYRLTVPFDETSTWSSLTDGILIGTDTEATADVSTGLTIATEGTRSFDVTNSLRAWQAGATNNGWAVINGGADSWSFRSQDWTVAAEKPMLTVVYEK